jgi:peptide/nickel transport system substrate-binding protein
LGLKKGADGVRMRPDGKPLQIVLTWFLIGPMNADLPRLVAEYWTAAGVKTTPKQYERSAYGAMRNSGEYDVGWSTMPGLTEYTLQQNPYKVLPPYSMAAMKWGDWYNTGGKTGEEPTQDVKDFIEVVEKFRETRPGTPEYVEIGKKMFEYYTKSLYNIGLVGMAPVPFMIKNNLKNTPTQEMMDKPTWAWDYRFHMIFNPDQWYFEE